LQKTKKEKIGKLKKRSNFGQKRGKVGKKIDKYNFEK